MSPDLAEASSQDLSSGVWVQVILAFLMWAPRGRTKAQLPRAPCRPLEEGSVSAAFLHQGPANFVQAMATCALSDRLALKVTHALPARGFTSAPYMGALPFSTLPP